MDKKPRVKYLTKDMLFYYALSGGVITREAFEKQFDREFTYRNYRQKVKLINDKLGPIEKDKLVLKKVNNNMLKQYAFNNKHTLKTNYEFINENDQIIFKVLERILKINESETKAIRDEIDIKNDNYIFISSAINEVYSSDNIFKQINKMLDCNEKVVQLKIYTDINKDLTLDVILHKVYFIDGQFYLVYTVLNKTVKEQYGIEDKFKTVNVAKIKSLKFQDSGIKLSDSSVNQIEELKKKITTFLTKDAVSNKNIHEAFKNFLIEKYYEIFILVPIKGDNGKNISTFFLDMNYLRSQERVNDKDKEFDCNKYEMFKYRVNVLEDFHSVITKWSDHIVIHKILQYYDGKTSEYDIKKFIGSYSEKFFYFIKSTADNNSKKEDIIKNTLSLFFKHFKEDQNIIEDWFVENKHIKGMLENINKNIE